MILISPSIVRFVIAISAAGCLVAGWQKVNAQDEVSSAGISDQDPDRHLLRYDLKEGEILPYEVTHVAKTKT